MAAERATPSEAEQEQGIQLSTADLQSSRKSISRSVDLITWNINRGSYKGTEHPALRDKILHIVIKSISKDGIYFLQEITNHKKTGDCFEYRTDHKSRSTQIYSSPHCKNLEVITKDLNLCKSDVTDLFIPRLLANEVTFLDKVGEEEYSSSMILMSYHAKYKDTADVKISQMVQFFDEMCVLADKKKRTIIIGGDFNLSVFHWKPSVEEKYPGRVFIAVYPTTPRRSDASKFLDTFATVQPKKEEYQTECKLYDTVAIYPFPVVDTLPPSSDTEGVLRSYPPTGAQIWFKYIYYNEEDKKAIKEIIEKKWTTDVGNKGQKVGTRKKKGEEVDAGEKKGEEVDAGGEEVDAGEKVGVVDAGGEEVDAGEKKVVDAGGEEVDAGEKKGVVDAGKNKGKEAKDVKDKVEEVQDATIWLTEYYSKPEFPRALPLWPCSPLNSVFDHDPIFTKLDITLTCDSKQDEHESVDDLDKKFNELSMEKGSDKNTIQEPAGKKMTFP